MLKNEIQFETALMLNGYFKVEKHKFEKEDTLIGSSWDFQCTLGLHRKWLKPDKFGGTFHL